MTRPKWRIYAGPDVPKMLENFMRVYDHVRRDRITQVAAQVPCEIAFDADGFGFSITGNGRQSRSDLRQSWYDCNMDAVQWMRMLLGMVERQPIE